jgi:hypothetical protein
MLLLNALPSLYVLLLTLLIWHETSWHKLAVAGIGVYVVPPLCLRILYTVAGKPHGCIQMRSSAFLVWWASIQTQVLFARVPLLEELLRLVPGLYSFWLRLWGSRIGRFTYWAPGTTILDRSYLQIGDDVVLGAGTRLTPHLIAESDGERKLFLADIEVGEGVLIGGYSLLTCGCRVASGESPRACLILPPFSEYANGVRNRSSSVK